jgi:DNA (cytosine-5)-methyltransferase 1
LRQISRILIGIVKKTNNEIPVIDLFAGPGGLSEGFAAYCFGTHWPFRIGLSVEKDVWAHQTLELRAFFRQFGSRVPEDYYRLLRGELSRDQLFRRHPEERDAAKREARHAELGSESLTDRELDSWIFSATSGTDRWILIGGPPCQAYSVVGRSRNKGKKGYSPENDRRHFLYREYLRIISKHWPAVFVMENVKGLLSSKIQDSKIFHEMLDDLASPGTVFLNNTAGEGAREHRYRIYSLVRPSKIDLFGVPGNPATDFVIECEKYGIPQARHRVILLGVRDDVSLEPSLLIPSGKSVKAGDVLGGLPRLRSGLSQGDDNRQNWQNAMKRIGEMRWLAGARAKAGDEVLDLMLRTIEQLRSPRHDRGGEFLQCQVKADYREEWYLDHRIGGVCNSTTRTHIEEDLYRYFYLACFAAVHACSPRLCDLPEALYPEHRNVSRSLGHDNFADRFRVQLKGVPSTTVVSHIAKDGHYYIHYDPSQCRSLTVREAARLQTFPDNYFFCGNRTAQYTQVGNAVPPLLANQIASIVYEILAVAQPYGRQAYA